MKKIELWKRLDKKLHKWIYYKRLDNDFYYTSISETEYKKIQSQFTNKDIYEAYGNGWSFSTTYKIKD